MGNAQKWDIYSFLSVLQCHVGSSEGTTEGTSLLLLPSQKLIVSDTAVEVVKTQKRFKLALTRVLHFHVYICGW